MICATWPPYTSRRRCACRSRCAPLTFEEWPIIGPFWRSSPLSGIVRSGARPGQMRSCRFGRVYRRPLFQFATDGKGSTAPANDCFQRPDRTAALGPKGDAFGTTVRDPLLTVPQWEASFADQTQDRAPQLATLWALYFFSRSRVASMRNIG